MSALTRCEKPKGRLIGVRAAGRDSIQTEHGTNLAFFRDVHRRLYSRQVWPDGTVEWFEVDEDRLAPRVTP